MKIFLAILSCSLFAAVLAAISVPAANKVEATSVKPKSFRCPDFCTTLYNPICARNNRCIATFGNPCKLDEYNCKRYKKDQFVRVDPKYCKNFSIPNYLYCW